MKQRYLHYVWRRFCRVRPLYLVALVLACLVLSLGALRHNNEQMVRLRDAVYAADKNNGDVEGALRTLRTYVYGHMNTSLSSGPNAVHPPIQLKYTYERLQQTQQTALGQGNSPLYAAAQAYCEGQTVIGSEVISCIQQYAAAHGAQLLVVPDGLYKFDFTAAKWSWDAAGWSLLLTTITVILLILNVGHRFRKKYF